MDLPQDLPHKLIVPVIFKNIKRYLLVSSLYDLLIQADKSIWANINDITSIETSDGFLIDDELFCSVVLQYSHCSNFAIELKTEDDDVDR